MNLWSYLRTTEVTSDKPNIDQNKVLKLSSTLQGKREEGVISNYTKKYVSCVYSDKQPQLICLWIRALIKTTNMQGSIFHITLPFFSVLHLSITSNRSVTMHAEQQELERNFISSNIFFQLVAHKSVWLKYIQVKFFSGWNENFHYTNREQLVFCVLLPEVFSFILMLRESTHYLTDFLILSEKPESFDWLFACNETSYLRCKGRV